MKKSKRLLSLLLALTMAFSLVGNAAVAAWADDVPQSPETVASDNGENAPPTPTRTPIPPTTAVPAMPIKAAAPAMPMPTRLPPMMPAPAATRPLPTATRPLPRPRP